MAAAPTSGFFLRGSRGEKTVSAQQTDPKAAPRLSRSHGDAGWSHGSGAPAGQGPQAAERLNGGPRGAAVTEPVTPRPDEPQAGARPIVGPRPAVLKTRALFLAVAATRQRAVMAGVVVQIRPHTAAEIAGGMPPWRYGLTASRKVGKAVQRNRARRRLRALAHAMLPRIVPPHHDIVLVARAETVTRPAWALRRDVEAAVRRLLRPSRRISDRGSVST